MPATHKRRNRHSRYSNQNGYNSYDNNIMDDEHIDVDTSAHTNSYGNKRARHSLNNQFNHHNHTQLDNDEYIDSDEYDSDYNSQYEQQLYADAPSSSDNSGSDLEVVGVGYGDQYTSDDNNDQYYEYLDYDVDNERPSKKMNFINQLNKKQQQKLVQLLDEIPSDDSDLESTSSGRSGRTSDEYTSASDSDSSSAATTDSDADNVDGNSESTPTIQVISNGNDTGDVIDNGIAVSSDDDDLTSDSDHDNRNNTLTQKQQNRLDELNNVDYSDSDHTSDSDFHDEEEYLVRQAIIDELKQRSNDIIDSTINSLTKSITDIYSNTHSVRRAERETRQLLHQKLAELSDAITFVHSDLGDHDVNIAELEE